MPRQEDTGFVCAATNCSNPIPRRQAIVHHQRFCSEGCRTRQWHWHRRTHEQLSREDKSCARCGKEMLWGRTDARYCSATCRSAAYRARRKLERDRHLVAVRVAEKTGCSVEEALAVFGQGR
jgi:hypothetical protein